MTWSRTRLEISGPLAPYDVGFTEWLVHKGYAPAVVRIQQRRMLHLSSWMQAQKIEIASFGPATVEAFIVTMDAQGRFRKWRMGSWAALLEYLATTGLSLADPPPTVRTAVDVLLARYANYLAAERGLADRTIARNVDAAREFVATRHCGDQLDLEQLNPGDITTFVLERSRQRPRSVPHLVTGLRSLLRFLHAEGITVTALADAVPTFTRWKLAGLPKALPEDQVGAMLASCDRTTTVGRRDLAILTMLSRLGLRIAEVAELRLDDIDWRRGELLVNGKGRRRERMPLPSDVGEAVVAYLSSARPKTAVRQVFLCARAPYRAMSRNAVTNVVARAARRIGMEGPVHAHRLRHSAATAMLGAGASLDEIGQVLRHQDALTTVIYAKVDVESLRAIARAWPLSGEAAA